MRCGFVELALAATGQCGDTVLIWALSSKIPAGSETISKPSQLSVQHRAYSDARLMGCNAQRLLEQTELQGNDAFH
jgi:hypothetical protein